MITGSIITDKMLQNLQVLTYNLRPQDDSYYLTIGGLDIKNFDLLINGKVITQFNTYRHCCC